MGNETRSIEVRDLIRRAADAGVKLWLQNGDVRYQARIGGIPEALRAPLLARKDDIIAELSRPDFKSCPEPPPLLQYPAYWLDFWQETQADMALRHGCHFALRIRGGMDLERIAVALDRLTSRHDLLRSTLRRENGVPCLRLSKDRQVGMDVFDISTEPPSERPARVSDLLQRAIYDAFSGDQLYRATVLKTSDEECVIAVVVHHFVADAYTCGILARELSDFLREGPPPEPDATRRPIQYSDYLLAMNEWLSGRALSYRLAFWMDTMRDAPPVRFPPLTETVPSQLLKNESVSIHVTAALRAALALAAGTCRVSLQTVLLAAKFAALSRTLESTDLVVDVVYWGRDDPALLELVGLTINCIPVRVLLPPAFCYFDLVTAVSRSYLLARDYHLPWSLLVRSFGQIGASSVAPLFNYIPVDSPSQSDSSSSHRQRTLEIGRVSIPELPRVISADWKAHEFTVSDDGNEIFATVSYVASKYDPTVVRTFADNFLRCLQAMARDVRSPLSTLPRPGV